MGVDPTDALPVDTPALYQSYYFIVMRDRYTWQRREIVENASTLMQISAREFAEDKRVRENEVVLEKRA